MSKMRVYELAKLLDMNNKELLSMLNKLKISAKSHMSSLDDTEIERVTREVENRKKNGNGKNRGTSKSGKKGDGTVYIRRGACVKDLADELGISAAEAVKALMKTGMMTPASAELNDDILLVLSEAKHVSIKWKEEESAKPAVTAEAAPVNEANLRPRPPIVTVMGHVDHGKTSLLDSLRKTRVTAREAGGITQHIGASHITYNGHDIVFLDTPGHAAFTSMRARGAQCTDIAILVVAADDGVMPQTVEAIHHAQAAGVPIIVAINKMDKPTANPDRVIQELSTYNVIAEDWGGDVPMVPISAKKGTGLDDLLEMVNLVAEMLELKADPTAPVTGVVIEARLDKGRGPMASVIVQNGTLHRGDLILFDSCWCKVRAMIGDTGKNVKKATPGTPVELLGLSSVPQPGEHFQPVESEKVARDHFANIEAEKRNRAMNTTTRHMTLEDLYSQVKEGEVPVLTLVLKTDVQGTTEAIIGSLKKLATDEVGINVVHSGVGRISESDIMLATASNAIVVGFNVRPENGAEKLAEQEHVQIRLYSIIYEILDDIKAAMEGLLQPDIKENITGKVEIRQLFKAPKVGKIAGCRVMNGEVKRNSKCRIIRDGVVIWDGEIASLRRGKDEAGTVREGFECGITFVNYQDFREGDELEIYELIEEKRTL